ncbi:putative transmembrane protein [Toxoplasma gondii VEG]|uniref:Putative transmembrane protein n=3 Tax=Toxoplasma gondii TaxID=5811 RepID=B9Q591_TOXGV|nr:putative transmembrane protein [Toxoplasma gondii VEG]KFG52485.1 putative transmembrane protein [Toxoplasma gondii p89]PUA87690.1 putative transmembrane protein [Toxoplasma gondii TgCATBr9]CEL75462.1 TPA: hypothetical protein BN1205_015780 [Toxoplasma gondii VEG]
MRLGHRDTMTLLGLLHVLLFLFFAVVLVLPILLSLLLPAFVRRFPLSKSAKRRLVYVVQSAQASAQRRVTASELTGEGASRSPDASEPHSATRLVGNVYTAGPPLSEAALNHLDDKDDWFLTVVSIRYAGPLHFADISLLLEQGKCISEEPLSPPHPPSAASPGSVAEPQAQPPRDKPGDLAEPQRATLPTRHTFLPVARIDVDDVRLRLRSIPVSETASGDGDEETARDRAEGLVRRLGPLLRRFVRRLGFQAASVLPLLPPWLFASLGLSYVVARLKSARHVAEEDGSAPASAAKSAPAGATQHSVENGCPRPGQGDPSDRFGEPSEQRKTLRLLLECSSVGVHVSLTGYSRPELDGAAPRVSGAEVRGAPREETWQGGAAGSGDAGEHMETKAEGPAGTEVLARATEESAACGIALVPESTGPSPFVSSPPRSASSGLREALHAHSSLGASGRQATLASGGEDPSGDKRPAASRRPQRCMSYEENSFLALEPVRSRADGVHLLFSPRKSDRVSGPTPRGASLELEATRAGQKNAGANRDSHAPSFGVIGQETPARPLGASRPSPLSPASSAALPGSASPPTSPSKRPDYEASAARAPAPRASLFQSVLFLCTVHLAARSCAFRVYRLYLSVLLTASYSDSDENRERWQHAHEENLHLSQRVVFAPSVRPKAARAKRKARSETSGTEVAGAPRLRVRAGMAKPAPNCAPALSASHGDSSKETGSRIRAEERATTAPGTWNAASPANFLSSGPAAESRAWISACFVVVIEDLQVLPGGKFASLLVDVAVKRRLALHVLHPSADLHRILPLDVTQCVNPLPRFLAAVSASPSDAEETGEKTTCQDSARARRKVADARHMREKDTARDIVVPAETSPGLGYVGSFLSFYTERFGASPSPGLAGPSPGPDTKLAPENPHFSAACTCLVPPSSLSSPEAGSAATFHPTFPPPSVPLDSVSRSVSPSMSDSSFRPAPPVHATVSTSPLCRALGDAVATASTLLPPLFVTTSLGIRMFFDTAISSCGTASPQLSLPTSTTQLSELCRTGGVAHLLQRSVADHPQTQRRPGKLCFVRTVDVELASDLLVNLPLNQVGRLFHLYWAFAYAARLRALCHRPAPGEEIAAQNPTRVLPAGPADCPSPPDGDPDAKEEIELVTEEVPITATISRVAVHVFERSSASGLLLDAAQVAVRLDIETALVLLRPRALLQQQKEDERQAYWGKHANGRLRTLERHGSRRFWGGLHSLLHTQGAGDDRPLGERTEASSQGRSALQGCPNPLHFSAREREDDDAVHAKRKDRSGRRQKPKREPRIVARTRFRFAVGTPYARLSHASLEVPAAPVLPLPLEFEETPEVREAKCNSIPASTRSPTADSAAHLPRQASEVVVEPAPAVEPGETPRPPLRGPEGPSPPPVTLHGAVRRDRKVVVQVVGELASVHVVGSCQKLPRWRQSVRVTAAAAWLLWVEKGLLYWLMLILHLKTIWKLQKQTADEKLEKMAALSASVPTQDVSGGPRKAAPVSGRVEPESRAVPSGDQRRGKSHEECRQDPAHLRGERGAGEQVTTEETGEATGERTDRAQRTDSGEDTGTLTSAQETSEEDEESRELRRPFMHPVASFATPVSSEKPLDTLLEAEEDLSAFEARCANCFHARFFNICVFSPVTPLPPASPFASLSSLAFAESPRASEAREDSDDPTNSTGEDKGNREGENTRKNPEGNASRSRAAIARLVSNVLVVHSSDVAESTAVAILPLRVAPALLDLPVSGPQPSANAEGASKKSAAGDASAASGREQSLGQGLRATKAQLPSPDLSGEARGSVRSREPDSEAAATFLPYLFPGRLARTVTSQARIADSPVARPPTCKTSLSPELKSDLGLAADGVCVAAECAALLLCLPFATPDVSIEIGSLRARVCEDFLLPFQSFLSAAQSDMMAHRLAKLKADVPVASSVEPRISIRMCDVDLLLTSNLALSTERLLINIQPFDPVSPASSSALRPSSSLAEASPAPRLDSSTSPSSVVSASPPAIRPRVDVALSAPRIRFVSLSSSQAPPPQRGRFVAPTQRTFARRGVGTSWATGSETQVPGKPSTPSLGLELSEDDSCDMYSDASSRSPAAGRRSSTLPPFAALPPLADVSPCLAFVPLPLPPLLHCATVRVCVKVKTPAEFAHSHPDPSPEGQVASGRGQGPPGFRSGPFPAGLPSRENSASFEFSVTSPSCGESQPDVVATDGERPHRLLLSPSSPLAHTRRSTLAKAMPSAGAALRSQGSAESMFAVASVLDLPSSAVVSPGSRGPASPGALSSAGGVDCPAREPSPAESGGDVSLSFGASASSSPASQAASAPAGRSPVVSAWEQQRVCVSIIGCEVCLPPPPLTPTRLPGGEVCSLLAHLVKSVSESTVVILRTVHAAWLYNSHFAQVQHSLLGLEAPRPHSFDVAAPYFPVLVHPSGLSSSRSSQFPSPSSLSPTTSATEDATWGPCPFEENSSPLPGPTCSREPPASGPGPSCGPSASLPGPDGQSWGPSARQFASTASLALPTAVELSLQDFHVAVLAPCALGTHLETSSSFLPLCGDHKTCEEDQTEHFCESGGVTGADLFLFLPPLVVLPALHAAVARIRLTDSNGEVEAINAAAGARRAPRSSGSCFLSYFPQQSIWPRVCPPLLLFGLSSASVALQDSNMPGCASLLRRAAAASFIRPCSTSTASASRGNSLEGPAAPAGPKPPESVKTMKAAFGEATQSLATLSRVSSCSLVCSEKRLDDGDQLCVAKPEISRQLSDGRDSISRAGAATSAPGASLRPPPLPQRGSQVTSAASRPKMSLGCKRASFVTQVMVKDFCLLLFSPASSSQATVSSAALPLWPLFQRRQRPRDVPRAEDTGNAPPEACGHQASSRDGDEDARPGQRVEVNASPAWVLQASLLHCAMTQQRAILRFRKRTGARLDPSLSRAETAAKLSVSRVAEPQRSHHTETAPGLSSATIATGLSASCTPAAGPSVSAAKAAPSAGRHASAPPERGTSEADIVAVAAHCDGGIQVRCCASVAETCAATLVSLRLLESLWGPAATAEASRLEASIRTETAVFKAHLLGARRQARVAAAAVASVGAALRAGSVPPDFPSDKLFNMAWARAALEENQREKARRLALKASKAAVSARRVAQAFLVDVSQSSGAEALFEIRGVPLLRLAVPQAATSVRVQLAWPSPSQGLPVASDRGATKCTEDDVQRGAGVEGRTVTLVIDDRGQRRAGEAAREGGQEARVVGSRRELGKERTADGRRDAETRTTMPTCGSRLPITASLEARLALRQGIQCTTMVTAGRETRQRLGASADVGNWSTSNAGRRGTREERGESSSPPLLHIAQVDVSLAAQLVGQEGATTHAGARGSATHFPVFRTKGVSPGVSREPATAGSEKWADRILTRTEAKQLRPSVGPSSQPRQHLRVSLQAQMKGVHAPVARSSGLAKIPTRWGGGRDGGCPSGKPAAASGCGQEPFGAEEAFGVGASAQTEGEDQRLFGPVPAAHLTVNCLPEHLALLLQLMGTQAEQERLLLQLLRTQERLFGGQSAAGSSPLEALQEKITADLFLHLAASDLHTKFDLARASIAAIEYRDALHFGAFTASPRLLSSDTGRRLPGSRDASHSRRGVPPFRLHPSASRPFPTHTGWGCKDIGHGNIFFSEDSESNKEQSPERLGMSDSEASASGWDRTTGSSHSEAEVERPRRRRELPERRRISSPSHFAPAESGSEVKSGRVDSQSAVRRDRQGQARVLRMARPHKDSDSEGRSRGRGRFLGSDKRRSLPAGSSSSEESPRRGTDTRWRENEEGATDHRASSKRGSTVSTRRPWFEGLGTWAEQEDQGRWDSGVTSDSSTRGSSQGGRITGSISVIGGARDSSTDEGRSELTSAFLDANERERHRYSQNERESAETSSCLSGRDVEGGVDEAPRIEGLRGGVDVSDPLVRRGQPPHREAPQISLGDNDEHPHLPSLPSRSGPTQAPPTSSCLPMHVGGGAVFALKTRRCVLIVHHTFFGFECPAAPSSNSFLSRRTSALDRASQLRYPRVAGPVSGCASSFSPTPATGSCFQSPGSRKLGREGGQALPTQEQLESRYSRTSKPAELSHSDLGHLQDPSAPARWAPEPLPVCDREAAGRRVSDPIVSSSSSSISHSTSFSASSSFPEISGVGASGGGSRKARRAAAFSRRVPGTLCVSRWGLRGAGIPAEPTRDAERDFDAGRALVGHVSREGSEMELRGNEGGYRQWSLRGGRGSAALGRVSPAALALLCGVRVPPPVPEPQSLVLPCVRVPGIRVEVLRENERVSEQKGQGGQKRGESDEGAGSRDPHADGARRARRSVSGRPRGTAGPSSSASGGQEALSSLATSSASKPRIGRMQLFCIVSAPTVLISPSTLVCFHHVMLLADACRALLLSFCEQLGEVAALATATKSRREATVGQRRRVGGSDTSELSCKPSAPLVVIDMTLLCVDPQANAHFIEAAQTAAPPLPLFSPARGNVAPVASPFAVSGSASLAFGGTALPARPHDPPASLATWEAPVAVDDDLLQLPRDVFCRVAGGSYIAASPWLSTLRVGVDWSALKADGAETRDRCLALPSPSPLLLPGQLRQESAHADMLPLLQPYAKIRCGAWLHHQLLAPRLTGSGGASDSEADDAESERRAGEEEGEETDGEGRAEVGRGDSGHLASREVRRQEERKKGLGDRVQFGTSSDPCEAATARETVETSQSEIAIRDFRGTKRHEKQCSWGLLKTPLGPEPSPFFMPLDAEPGPVGGPKACGSASCDGSRSRVKRSDSATHSTTNGSDTLLFSASCSTPSDFCMPYVDRADDACSPVPASSFLLRPLPSDSLLFAAPIEAPGAPVSLALMCEAARRQGWGDWRRGECLEVFPLEAEEAREALAEEKALDDLRCSLGDRTTAQLILSAAQIAVKCRIKIGDREQTSSTSPLASRISVDLLCRVSPLCGSVASVAAPGGLLWHRGARPERRGQRLSLSEDVRHQRPHQRNPKSNGRAGGERRTKERRAARAAGGIGSGEGNEAHRTKPGAWTRDVKSFKDGMHHVDSVLRAASESDVDAEFFDMHNRSVSCSSGESFYSLWSPGRDLDESTTTRLQAAFPEGSKRRQTQQLSHSAAPAASSRPSALRFPKSKDKASGGLHFRVAAGGDVSRLPLSLLSLGSEAMERGERRGESQQSAEVCGASKVMPSGLLRQARSFQRAKDATYQRRRIGRKAIGQRTGERRLSLESDGDSEVSAERRAVCPEAHLQSGGLGMRKKRVGQKRSRGVRRLGKAARRLEERLSRSRDCGRGTKQRNEVECEVSHNADSHEMFTSSDSESWSWASDTEDVESTETGETERQGERDSRPRSAQAQATSLAGHRLAESRLVSGKSRFKGSVSRLADSSASAAYPQAALTASIQQAGPCDITRSANHKGDARRASVRLGLAKAFSALLAGPAATQQASSAELQTSGHRDAAGETKASLTSVTQAQTVQTPEGSSRKGQRRGSSSRSPAREARQGRSDSGDTGPTHAKRRAAHGGTQAAGRPRQARRASGSGFCEVPHRYTSSSVAKPLLWLSDLSLMAETGLPMGRSSSRLFCHTCLLVSSADVCRLLQHLTHSFLLVRTVKLKGRAPAPKKKAPLSHLSMKAAPGAGKGAESALLTAHPQPLFTGGEKQPSAASLAAGKVSRGAMAASAAAAAASAAAAAIRGATGGLYSVVSSSRAKRGPFDPAALLENREEAAAAGCRGNPASEVGGGLTGAAFPAARRGRVASRHRHKGENDRGAGPGSSSEDEEEEDLVSRYGAEGEGTKDEEASELGLASIKEDQLSSFASPPPAGPSPPATQPRGQIRGNASKSGAKERGASLPFAARDRPPAPASAPTQPRRTNLFRTAAIRRQLIAYLQAEEERESGRSAVEAQTQDACVDSDRERGRDPGTCWSQRISTGGKAAPLPNWPSRRPRCFSADGRGRGGVAAFAAAAAAAAAAVDEERERREREANGEVFDRGVMWAWREACEADALKREGDARRGESQPKEETSKPNPAAPGEEKVILADVLINEVCWSLLAGPKNLPFCCFTSRRLSAATALQGSKEHRTSLEVDLAEWSILQLFPRDVPAVTAHGSVHNSPPRSGPQISFPSSCSAHIASAYLPPGFLAPPPGRRRPSCASTSSASSTASSGSSPSVGSSSVSSSSFSSSSSLLSLGRAVSKGPAATAGAPVSAGAPRGALEGLSPLSGPPSSRVPPSEARPGDVVASAPPKSPDSSPPLPCATASPAFPASAASACSLFSSPSVLHAPACPERLSESSSAAAVPATSSPSGLYALDLDRATSILFSSGGDPPGVISQVRGRARQATAPRLSLQTEKVKSLLRGLGKRRRSSVEGCESRVERGGDLGKTTGPSSTVSDNAQGDAASSISSSFSVPGRTRFSTFGVRDRALQVLGGLRRKKKVDASDDADPQMPMQEIASAKSSFADTGSASEVIGGERAPEGGSLVAWEDDDDGRHDGDMFGNMCTQQEGKKDGLGEEDCGGRHRDADRGSPSAAEGEFVEDGGEKRGQKGSRDENKERENEETAEARGDDFGEGESSSGVVSADPSSRSSSTRDLPFFVPFPSSRFISRAKATHGIPSPQSVSFSPAASSSPPVFGPAAASPAEAPFHDDGESARSFPMLPLCASKAESALGIEDHNEGENVRLQALVGDAAQPFSGSRGATLPPLASGSQSHSKFVGAATEWCRRQMDMRLKRRGKASARATPNATETERGLSSIAASSLPPGTRTPSGQDRSAAANTKPRGRRHCVGSEDDGGIHGESQRGKDERRKSRRKTGDPSSAAEDVEETDSWGDEERRSRRSLKWEDSEGNGVAASTESEDETLTRVYSKKKHAWRRHHEGENRYWSDAPFSAAELLMLLFPPGAVASPVITPLLDVLHPNSAVDDEQDVFLDLSAYRTAFFLQSSGGATSSQGGGGSPSSGSPLSATRPGSARRGRGESAEGSSQFGPVRNVESRLQTKDDWKAASFDWNEDLEGRQRGKLLQQLLGDPQGSRGPRSKVSAHAISIRCSWRFVDLGGAVWQVFDSLILHIDPLRVRLTAALVEQLYGFFFPPSSAAAPVADLALPSTHPKAKSAGSAASVGQSHSNLMSSASAPKGAKAALAGPASDDGQTKMASGSGASLPASAQSLSQDERGAEDREARGKSETGSLDASASDPPGVVPGAAARPASSPPTSAFIQPGASAFVGSEVSKANFAQANTSYAPSAPSLVFIRHVRISPIVALVRYRGAVNLNDVLLEFKPFVQRDKLKTWKAMVDKYIWFVGRQATGRVISHKLRDLIVRRKKPALFNRSRGSRKSVGGVQSGIGSLGAIRAHVSVSEMRKKHILFGTKL